MKYVSFFLGILLLSITEIYAQTATTPAGEGILDDPYQIATLENLYWLSQSDTAWDRHFIQTADIDASATSEWDGGSGFSPVGTDNSTSFTGTYNGKGHRIDQLYISRSGTVFIGLFGYMVGASVDSLGVTNVDITGRSNVGGLVGVNRESSVISNCFSTGKVEAALYYAGGLVGESIIDTEVINSYSTASAHAGMDYAGGLVGINTGALIRNCFATGAISGGSCIGGLVGRNQIESSVENCYSTGVPTGTSEVGGLIGGFYNSTATNSFWDTEISGIEVSAGGTGKTTAEMQTLCTYVDGTEASWDFMTTAGNGTADIWGMNAAENGGYPFLSWQGYAHTATCCGFQDNMNPELEVQDITLQLDETGNAYLDIEEVVTSATDNCTLADTTIGQSAFSCTDIDAPVSVEVTLTDEAGNATTETLAVTIEDQVLPEISCIEDQVIDLEEGETVYVVDGAEFDPVEVSDNCEGLTVENDFNNSASLAGEEIPVGATTIEWVVMDPSGNQQSCSFTVQVNAYVGYLKYTRSGNISIYPNPARDQVQLAFGSLIVKGIDLLDITGKKIREQDPDTSPMTIDISDLDDGLFFVRVVTLDSTETFRIVKE